MAYGAPLVTRRWHPIPRCLELRYRPGAILPATAWGAVLARLMVLSPCLRELVVLEANPRRLRVQLRLKWRSWLTLGLLHVFLARSIRRYQNIWLPDGWQVEVDVR